jgi:hypothetical protein
MHNSSIFEVLLSHGIASHDDAKDVIQTDLHDLTLMTDNPTCLDSSMLSSSLC